MLPEKFTYTFVKEKTWVYHYSLKFITSESTKQATVLESVSGHRVCCKPSLLPCPWPQPSPHAGTGTEAAVLWQGLRGWGWHSTSCTHTPYTQLTPCLPQLPLWHRAIKPIHTASPAENTSTANQEHLQEHCSFPLHLQFPPEVKHWHGADQWLKHTLLWVRQHTLPFSTRWPETFSFLAVGTKQRANNPKPCSGT